MKISVVVPVYNPGQAMRRCVDSILHQTLAAGDFEAIFVDDGSSDDTPARLDELAAEHRHIRVIHQENSGWPGKPRNRGLEAARGAYVFFCDDDDWFGVEALERLYVCARRNGSDIVIGKMIGHGRRVPVELFRRNRAGATLADAPLIDSLTAHKLFRRAFLQEHRLRFPEEKRRLEDQLFVVQAYFAARRIDVLSDYPVYHHTHRKGGGIASAPIEPRSYYHDLRDVLAVVETNTAPGELRDSLLRRFLRVEMLGRLDRPRFLRREPDYRQRVYGEIRRLMLERFPESVDAGLPPRTRLLAALVRADRYEDLLVGVQWSTDVRVVVQAGQPAWVTGTLRIPLTARLVTTAGTPLPLTTSPEGPLLDPPVARQGLPQQTLQAEPTVAEAAPVEIVVTHIKDGDQHVLGDRCEARLRPVDDQHRELLVECVARLDPRKAAGGQPLGPGSWWVEVRTHLLGWTGTTPLRKDLCAGEPEDLPPVHIEELRTFITPGWTGSKRQFTLRVEVRPPPPTRSARVRRSARRLRRTIERRAGRLRDAATGGSRTASK